MTTSSWIQKKSDLVEVRTCGTSSNRNDSCHATFLQHKRQIWSYCHKMASLQKGEDRSWQTLQCPVTLLTKRHSNQNVIDRFETAFILIMELLLYVCVGVGSRYHKTKFTATPKSKTLLCSKESLTWNSRRLVTKLHQNHSGKLTKQNFG